MKEGTLLRKIKRLLRKANVPRFLHSFGPKTYEFKDHLLALLVRELCKLSYRKAAGMLCGLGFNCPSYSALAKMLRRVPRALIDALFAAVSSFKTTVVAAMDGTYYARASPSFHYLARVNRAPPRSPIQVVALLDTRRKKWLALSTRLKRVHELRDVNKLLSNAPAIINLAIDKIGDSEELHRSLEREWHIQPHIPVRRNVRKGVYRKKHTASFRLRTYHRRSLIESAFGKNKRTQGQAVKNRLAKTIRTEIQLRYLNDNLGLFSRLLETFNRAL